jgi:hypothetical protein
MNKRRLAKLEKKVPENAVAALNAAHRRVVAACLPHVLVIGDGLYRVHETGKKELIRVLPPRIAVAEAKRAKT